MAINYGSLFPGPTIDTVTDPQQLFQALPSKAKKYAYLRDVQGDVLSKWQQGPKPKDTVIKMNTGGGKTTVGLLMLKCSINEGFGPAVYACPDHYLCKQVEREAASLGLRYTDDPRSPDYQSGRAILICPIQVIFNGWSKFGVGHTSDIEIGTIVIDDAHACIGIVEKQFTLVFQRETGAFTKLFSLFEENLKSQSITTTYEISQGISRGFAQVPYWAWQDRQSDVVAIINTEIDEEQRKFVWPLIKESLAQTRCFFNAKRIEISSHCLPIEHIPSFEGAKRRIYMTATLSNDSILVTTLGADPAGVSAPITPKTASDIGDRMILTPQQINPKVTDEEICTFLQSYSKTQNVVVIVPSSQRAQFWKEAIAKCVIVDAKNIETEIEKLKKSKGNFSVLLNKYDGIDLPDEACRILVIDGVPDTRQLLDKYDQGALSSSDRFRSMQMQRIEQGMGRGIRSNEDYCVVLLMGAQLLRVMYAAGAVKHLSPATRQQLELSHQVANQIEKKGLGVMAEPISDVLKRNPGWVTVSKNNLISVTYPEIKIDPVALALRRAYEAVRRKQHQEAFRVLQDTADKAEDKVVAGWLLDQAAEAMYGIDKVQSQTILVAANKKNYRVTRPLAGISYAKLGVAVDQAREASEFLCDTYVDAGNQVVLGINGILDSLVFQPDNSEEFEQALMELGQHLGFRAQRPEKEGGGKLDVLWAIGQSRYLMLACKSESAAATISKQYADQVSGNVNWFKQAYETDQHSIPAIVHPSLVFAADATPPVDTRIITKKQLDQLKDASRKYALAIKDRIDDVEFIRSTLIANHLNGEQFVTNFTAAKKSKA